MHTYSFRNLTTIVSFSLLAKKQKLTPRPFIVALHLTNTVRNIAKKNAIIQVSECSISWAVQVTARKGDPKIPDVWFFMHCRDQFAFSFNYAWCLPRNHQLGQTINEDKNMHWWCCGWLSQNDLEVDFNGKGQFLLWFMGICFEL